MPMVVPLVGWILSFIGTPPIPFLALPDASGPPSFVSFFEHVFDEPFDRFWIDFLRFFAPTWSPKSARNRKQIDQNANHFFNLFF